MNPQTLGCVLLCVSCVPMATPVSTPTSATPSGSRAASAESGSPSCMTREDLARYGVVMRTSTLVGCESCNQTWSTRLYVINRRCFAVNEATGQPIPCSAFDIAHLRSLVCP